MLTRVKWRRLVNNLVVGLFSLLLLALSTVAPGNTYEQIRAYTRSIEFDYINWTLDALLVKNVQQVVNVPTYINAKDQRRVIFEYFSLVRQVDRVNAEIEQIYANPAVSDPKTASADRVQRLNRLKEMQNALKPIAEAVLQHQVSSVVADLGLGAGGQPIPPVLYHSTSLPYALIISPRDTIRQDYDISLQADLSMEEITQVEEAVSKSQNVSALVVPVGGVGIYPTMVMNTTDINWLAEVVSHEWTHNFLTLRPLGVLYMSSPDLRTINETTANLAGKEIGRAVMERYYPDLVPPPSPEEAQADNSAPAAPEDPNKFSFTREMHTTRVTTDELLKAGKIQEAEDYMELRRRFLWDHGYQIRKLNQAYFAFYGAYNDQPGGGAAGQDPVGPAVQALRKKSSSLSDFLNRIAWVTSFTELQNLIR